jgi:hypothetical protein
METTSSVLCLSLAGMVVAGYTGKKRPMPGPEKVQKSRFKVQGKGERRE